MTTLIDDPNHWYIREPALREIQERPSLGEWCMISATGHKGIDGNQRRWREWNFESPFPAMFIGYRTVYDGTIEYIEDEGNIFTPTSHQEVWLFVRNPRQRPIYAFPCSVKREVKP